MSKWEAVHEPQDVQMISSGGDVVQSKVSTSRMEVPGGYLYLVKVAGEQPIVVPFPSSGGGAAAASGARGEPRGESRPQAVAGGGAGATRRE